MIHVDPRDVIVAVLVNHVNKVHGLMIKAKQTDPFFKCHVLFFHFSNQPREQGLHLFLQHEHLRDFGVGVLADNVLELTPKHLFAFVVE